MKRSRASHKSLRQRVERWAARLKVQPRVVRIQKMTRKWGSCSTSGTITLTTDLSAHDDGFQDFVVVHELLHMRIPNHGRLFKAMMTAYVPKWRSYNAGRRKARKLIRSPAHRAGLGRKARAAPPKLAPKSADTVIALDQSRGWISQRRNNQAGGP
jgi:hypothetical protein